MVAVTTDYRSRGSASTGILPRETLNLDQILLSLVKGRSRCGSWFKDMALQGQESLHLFCAGRAGGIFFFCFTTRGARRSFTVGVVAVINVTFRAAYEE